MEEKTEKETEKLGEPPEKEIRVWGGGLVLKKMDKLIELQDRTNFLLAMNEKKIEKVIEILEKGLNTSTN